MPSKLNFLAFLLSFFSILAGITFFIKGSSLAKKKIKPKLRYYIFSMSGNLFTKKIFNFMSENEAKKVRLFFTLGVAFYTLAVWLILIGLAL